MLLGQHLHDLCREPQQCHIYRLFWSVFMACCCQISTNLGNGHPWKVEVTAFRPKVKSVHLRQGMIKSRGKSEPRQQWSTHRCWSSVMNLCNTILFRSGHRNQFAASKLPNLASDFRNKGSDATQTAPPELNSHWQIRYLTLDSLLGICQSNSNNFSSRIKD